MEEFYLYRIVNLRSIDYELYTEISKLFKKINTDREDLEGLLLTTFISEVKQSIENIKKIVEPIKQQPITENEQVLTVENIFDVTTSRGETLLMVAAGCGHYEIVEMLLAEQANPEIVTQFGWTALRSALTGGQKKLIDEECMPYYYAVAAFYRVNPNLKVDNYPVLHSEVAGGELGTLKLYLEAKANPNIIDERGDTPLHIAAAQSIYPRNPTRKKDVILLLLNAGAETDLKNKRNETPLMHVQDRDEEENQEVAQLLVTYQPEKMTLSCKEVLPIDDLCSIVMDYCFVENKEFKKRKIAAKNSDEVCQAQDITAFLPDKSAETNSDKFSDRQENSNQSLPIIQYEDSFHTNPQEQLLNNNITQETVPAPCLHPRPEDPVPSPQPVSSLTIPHQSYSTGTTEDLKSGHRSLQRISHCPLVISGITGSLGLAALFTTAFMTKDLLTKKVFYPILTMEAILTVCMVYIAYKLSNFKKVVHEQKELSVETSNSSNYGI